MNVNSISSIGWLNGIDRRINLTVCFGTGWPIFVNISRSEFDEIRHDKERMKQKAVELINQGKGCRSL